MWPWDCIASAMINKQFGFIARYRSATAGFPRHFALKCSTRYVLCNITVTSWSRSCRYGLMSEGYMHHTHRETAIRWALLLKCQPTTFSVNHRFESHGLYGSLKICPILCPWGYWLSTWSILGYTSPLKMALFCWQV